MIYETKSVTIFVFVVLCCVVGIAVRIVGGYFVKIEAKLSLLVELMAFQ